MKKILNLIFIIPLTLLLVACKKDNISPKILKNEYNINEQATIDNINITLKEVYKEQDIIEFIFEIENNRGSTITIDPDNNFKFYDNQLLLNNIYDNNTNIIKKENKLNYTLQYKIEDKKIYSIYFYSGVVENNIKFTITSSDIK